jgi:hypothetical protein
MTPKRATYRIATDYHLLASGRAQPTSDGSTVSGWVCGDYGMAKAKYNWEYTHLPTGIKISMPWIETIAPAKEQLVGLALVGLSEHATRMIAEYEPLPPA